MIPENKIDIWALIRKRYPAGEYVVLQEVRDNAGFQASRSADGVVFSLWPSRGLDLHGIEVKSFRSDWLHEKKNPKKAEAIFQYCDRFWLYCDDEKVVCDLAEIPDTWGFVVRKGNKLCTMKEAPKLTPAPLTRGFIAAMFKRATGGLIHPSQIQDKIDEATSRTTQEFELRNKSWETQFRSLEKTILDFETAAGIKIDNGWRSGPKETGEAVRWYLRGGHKEAEKDLLRLEKSAAEIHAAVTTALAALKSQQPTNGVEP